MTTLMQRIRGDHHGRTIFLAAIILLVLALPSFAKVQLSVDIGFSNRFRPGRWTPLYLTLTDSAPRQVTLEIYAPTDRRYAMKILQGLVIGPQPVTVPIYVPLSYQVDETTVNVLDANTGRRLETYTLSDTPAYGGPHGTGPDAVDLNTVFIGISGTSGSERMVEGQFTQNSVQCAYVSPELLPAVPIGYDALDLLVLNQADIARLSAEQQRAIADWILAGGMLVFWPGSNPPPLSGPLVELFPCTIGETQIVQTDTAVLSNAGLPARFAKLTARALTHPTADATPIFPLRTPEPQSTPWGYRRWAGFGQVVVLGPDISQLHFDPPQKARDFWKAALAGVMTLPIPDPNAPPNYNYYMATESRRSIPLRQTLDWIGDVPGAGQFGFTYVAGVLLALMFVVGPVDWFVLKWTGRQPWTWVTVTGWIALVTLGAIYAGHLFKAGDLYYRTASVIDEAGQMRVLATDLVGIYSPQTRDYQITTDAESFWKPASDGSTNGGSGLHVESAYHQDYRGNRPLGMLINVWNTRFQEGTQYGPAAPIIEAKLTRTADKAIAGKITNRGNSPICDVIVRTREGTAKFAGPIEPGASLTVDAKLNSRDHALATQPADEQRAQWQRYEVSSEATTRPAMPVLAGLGDARSVRIDEMLRDRSDIACIYATFDSSPDRAKLESEQPKTSHATLVRALIPLENSPGANSPGATR